MNEPAEPSLTKPPKDVAGLAGFYRTTERNIVRYRAKFAPLDDPIKFKAWIGTQASAPEALLERLEDFPDSAGSEPSFPDAADWEDFEKQARTADPNDAMAKISKVRDWAFFQFEKASKLKKKKDEKFYSDLLAKMEGTLHDAQLRAKKLGLEAGDLVPRAELENVARFLAYHLLRCADGALAKLSKAIAERDPSYPPITAQEVVALGEPLMITAMVFEPMERAMLGDNGAAPPEWLVAAMKEGREEVIEQ